MSTKRKDIVYGQVDIDESEFAPHRTKVRVTTMIDEDALLELKEVAQNKGIKYQTLLNKIVRSYVSSPRNQYNKGNLTEEKVRKIVRDELKKKKKA